MGMKSFGGIGGVAKRQKGRTVFADRRQKGEEKSKGRARVSLREAMGP